jgi:hypothetical protein
MRMYGKFVLVFGLAALVAGPVLAQPGLGRPGGGAGGLVQNEAVQKELKVTEEQAKKLKEALDKVNAAYRAEMEKAIAGALDEKQNKRLKQIQLQQMGTNALNTADVAKDLKLSDEQKTKIKETVEAFTKKSRELGFQDREERQKLRTETNEKLNSVLNDDQKKAFKEMLGETFTMPGRGPGGPTTPPRKDLNN